MEARISNITVSNLTFAYDDSNENIFENVSFTLDINWKLAFIGRNGRGKTTFLKLLLGKYKYSGVITAYVNFDYFPFNINDKTKNSFEIAEDIDPNFETFKLTKEIFLLNMNEEILERSFESLSLGEQTKILLAILFIKENNFLLLDEPTNHLDIEARTVVSKYLSSKKGFILVSHDRSFLDCSDHVLSINRTNIELQKGNFSSFARNKENQDNFELSKNEKLKKDIKRLEVSAKQTKDWSFKGEAVKTKGKCKSGLRPDRGFVGHKAAKLMKRSIVIENRKEKSVEEKLKLLKNLETIDSLKLAPLVYCKNKMIEALNLSIYYGKCKIIENVNFEVLIGDRVYIKGKNGCGKSSIIKLILGKAIEHSGSLIIGSGLKISYVPQNIDYSSNDLKNFAIENNLDESLFKAILRKFDFSKMQFEKNMENFSSGQKKKVLIARSLSEKAHIYIWDEPLNFIDIQTLIQIEELILEYKPTMIFVEHDRTFSEKIATKIVEI